MNIISTGLDGVVPWDEMAVEAHERRKYADRERHKRDYADPVKRAEILARCKAYRQRPEVKERERARSARRRKNAGAKPGAGRLSKIPYKTARAIRMEWANRPSVTELIEKYGVSVKSLAEKHGITVHQVRNILLGRTCTH
jgi:hypothetical protein